ncbi:fibroblast growth factor receptor 3-like isoform X1 [Acropora millepora]|uniref:fibroblast growth factor receptor 3-like isoform X1 n=1 Tax=Acropora millepora TaxID=45264 RepID=UPI001CF3EC92|nr:fibroblast growth factor receptor 3-like isoform X1 [Acropora millepora]
MASNVELENVYERKTKGRIPVKWTAYEALTRGLYTAKSDVWSFGVTVVLYEIFTIGGQPYPRTNARKLVELLASGYRMPKPNHVAETLYHIMRNCWQEEPDDRPSFEQLRRELKRMANQHKKMRKLEFIIIFQVLLGFKLIYDAECNPAFTSKPNNGAISYVLNGESALNLIWDYNSAGEVVKDVYLYYVERGKDVLVAAKYFPSGQYYVFPKTGYTNRVEFSGRATFTVKNIVPSDSRWFKCVINFNVPPQVQGAITSINSAAEVVVVVRPSIIQQERLSSVELNEHDTKLLLCVASGNPKPSYTWKKNGVIIQQSQESNYTITSAKKEDKGQYTCEAVVSVPELSFTHKASYTVDVKVKFAPHVNSLLSNQTLDEGNDASFTCKVEAYPASITFNWFKNLTKLSVNAEFSIVSSGSESRLTVRQIKKDSAAWYSCSGQNTVGTGEKKSVYLEVNLKSFPSHQEMTNVQEAPTEPAEDIDKDVIYATVISVLVVMMASVVAYVIIKRKRRGREVRQLEERETIEESHMNLNMEDGRDNEDSRTAVNRLNCMESNEIADSNGTYNKEQDNAPLNPATRSWEVSRENVVIQKKIGGGFFGQVAQGTACNLPSEKGTTTVAIKMVKEDADAAYKRALLSELDIMKKLEPHPHVIKLLGCVTITDPVLVIIEYVPYGDLLNYLRNRRGKNDNNYFDVTRKPQTSLSSLKLLLMSWQIADGMSYLSSKKIIHRDLAARNVLVGEGETCKITDYGMARNVQLRSVYEKKTADPVPIMWTAYEALKQYCYTTKSDVWSFGVVLYEIFTIGGEPYPAARINTMDFVELLATGYRMPKPNHVAAVLYLIMKRCWKENPDDRPSFEQLRDELKLMENQTQEPHQHEEP